MMAATREKLPDAFHNPSYTVVPPRYYYITPVKWLNVHYQGNARSHTLSPSQPFQGRADTTKTTLLADAHGMTIMHVTSERRTSRRAGQRYQCGGNIVADFAVGNGNLAQVVVWSTYQSSKILNVFHYEAICAAPIDDGPGEVLNLAQSFNALVINAVIGTKWRDWVVQAFQFNYTQAQIIHPTRRYYLSEVTDVTGVLMAEGCSSNIGATVLLQSNKVGRGRSGSKHFTGFDLNDAGGGTLPNATRTKVSETIDKAKATFSGVDPGLQWEARIWSASHPTDRNRIVSTYVWPESRIMRRRTLHVGI